LSRVLALEVKAAGKGAKRSRPSIKYFDCHLPFEALCNEGIRLGASGPRKGKTNVWRCPQRTKKEEPFGIKVE